MSDPGFIHLRVHSAYSLLEGAIHPKDLAALCVKRFMPAVAVTDRDNLFGAVDFSEAAVEAGVQPILGITLSVLRPTAERGAPAYYCSVALLVQNEAGYLNLSRLTSLAHVRMSEAGRPYASFDELFAHAEGLILLSGGPEGPLDLLCREGAQEAASALAHDCARAFPCRFYIELQRHDVPGESAVEDRLVSLAYALDLPLVATNQVFYADPGMFAAHDALLCIADGRYVTDDDRRRATPEHYFKTARDMQALFADLPEATANTVEIARRCGFALGKRAPILPPFPVREGESAADAIRTLAREGLERRLATYPLSRPADEYRSRLDYEIGVITSMGFEGYFLIVSDFMRWTRAQGIPVGVRGSGANSIAAWALEITSLDPIRFDLVFERFLNPERVSMPDFDIDFCQDRRGEVIRYVQDKYGADRVAQIITFGTLAARACVRDVGRVLNIGFTLTDRIAKLIPNQPGQQVTLSEAISGDGRLREMIRQDEAVERLFSIAKKLEGLYRNASTHAAGIVIGDRPLPELAPLYYDGESPLPATQFDWKDVETVGLVKFDFLGLRTLTAVAECERLLKARGLDVNTGDEVRFDDKRTYEMLSRGECVGIFQLESQGMRDLIRRMRPDRIEDLIALVALYRPGPMESIPAYIARKHGREQVSHVHPALAPLLAETYGVMTYQEDVMRIARELAGYSLGQADLLRRAMGKKDKAAMAKHRALFLKGAGERGIPEEAAEAIFDQAEKFSGYGFNKGHAASYAQLAYQTAFLKANYPAEFLCALMTLDLGSVEKLAVLRQEAERMGIAVLPPDINASQAAFSVQAGRDGSQAIRYGLAALRHVGRQAMEHVVRVREAGGNFVSLFDFARRVDPKLVNKRALESLAAAGAFDGLNPNRAQVFGAVDLMLGSAERALRDAQSGQVSLFGDAPGGADEPRLPLQAVWDSNETLQNEFEAVGFYLSGHPLDDYTIALRRLGALSYGDLVLRGQAGTLYEVAGIVIDRKDRRARDGGKPYAYVRLSDRTSVFESIVFSDLLQSSGDLLQPGELVLMRVTVEREGADIKMRTQMVRRLEEAARGASAGLRLFVSGQAPLPRVKALLEPRPGRGRVLLSALRRDGGSVEVELGQFAVSTDLRRALKGINGVEEVEEI